jgi:two-component system response regulator GlrR
VVLVVDDEPDVLESLADLLEAEFHYHAVTAGSGPEALGILGRQPVDAVVSDFRMPLMDGCEFLKEVAARHPRIPRLMLSAYGTPDVEQEVCRQVGLHAFLPKPVDPDRLASELRTALD